MEINIRYKRCIHISILESKSTLLLEAHLRRATRLSLIITKFWGVTNDNNVNQKFGHGQRVHVGQSPCCALDMKFESPSQHRPSVYYGVYIVYDICMYIVSGIFSYSRI